MEIEDEEIKLLMRVTLVTPTSKHLRLVIPFYKKFSPSVGLQHNTPIYLPVNNKLIL